MKKVFKSQEEGEEVVEVITKHPLVFLLSILNPIFLFLVSFLSMLFFFYVPMLFIVSFFVFMVALLWICYGYFVWSRDRFILTSNRIVGFSQTGLFRTTQKEAILGKIQDVTIETKSIWEKVFNFGSVLVSTASNSSIVLDDVKDPIRIQKAIFKQIEEFVAVGKSEINEDMVRELLALLKKNNTP